jgi:calcium/calmodulin-dependent protein kinase I
LSAISNRSVGVILYILLSGFSPFDDVSESALFKKIKKVQYSFQASVWETITDGGIDPLI